jgi:hypothetical protein
MKIFQIVDEIDPHCYYFMISFEHFKGTFKGGQMGILSSDNLVFDGDKK